MSQRKHFRVSTIPQTTLRRLRVLPGYFFLIWRWGTWLYAFCVIGWSLIPGDGSIIHYSGTNAPQAYRETAILLLIITFIETLIVTLYIPVIHILLPRILRPRTWRKKKGPRQRLQATLDEKENGPFSPFGITHNQYWNMAIYGMDVIICGLVTYYSGPFSDPPFGLGSPFYRYGMSSVFASAFVYGYQGGLLAAAGYDFFSILGIIIHAPGWPGYQFHSLVDVGGSIVDTPLAAILVAYLAMLLESYTQSKRNEQENARTQKYLARVSETLLKSADNRKELLQRSLSPIQQAWHFDYIVIALIKQNTNDDHVDEKEQLDTIIEETFYHTIDNRESRACLEKTLETRQKILSFDSLETEEDEGIARLYLPFSRDNHIQIIIGVESKRTAAFGGKQENFLTIVGLQILVCLDNIRLAEQTIELAATAERTRIAREIHDGIAQLTYMLSLQAETCQAQALRIAEASEEDTELIMPLTQRLGRLVTISKQALWETRNYMFSLKPLMSGTTTLSEMLNNQLREFQAISDLSAKLNVEGKGPIPSKEKTANKKDAQIGATLFRIVQEALTNAYKHAEATEVIVYLRYTEKSIEIEICDNGKGMGERIIETDGRMILSGHGMQGMRERTEELDGTFTTQNRATGGLSIRAYIPL